MKIFNYFITRAGFIYVIQFDELKETHLQQTSKRYDDLFEGGNNIGIWKIKWK